MNVQEIMEWEHLGDGVDTTPIFRTTEMLNLTIVQLQLHTNASVTYVSNFIRRLGGSEAQTLNGSIELKDLAIKVDKQLEILWTGVAINNAIKVLFVVEDRG